MSIDQILSAATTAFHLILAFPAHWLVFFVVFIVLAQALMFIPYFGFALKLSVGMLIGAQGFVLLRQAASGVSPDLTTIFDAFGLPLMAQASIVLSSLIPFAIGMLYLQFAVGGQATGYFFGNILKAKPPEAVYFERFKYVMNFGTLPFMFVPPLVILGNVHDHTAIVRGTLLALEYWPVVLLLLGISLFGEWANVRVLSLLPKKLAFPLVGFMILANVVWTFAFSFTLYVAIAPPA